MLHGLGVEGLGVVFRGLGFIERVGTTESAAVGWAESPPSSFCHGLLGSLNLEQWLNRCTMMRK